MDNIISRIKSFSIAAVFFALCLHLALPTAVKAADNPLPSPIYAQYNTFLNGVNILELISAGTKSVDAKVAIYSTDGTFKSAYRYSIPPKTQQDIDINTLVGRVNRVGVVKITYNDSTVGALLQGRMTVYSSNDNGSTYAFAYSNELQNSSTGTTYAPSNSIDPRGDSYLMPNWAQLTNLDDSSQSFTHNLYSTSGSLVSTSTVTLAPFQRADISAGHESGESTFLNEFVPADSSTAYLASVTRYGTTISSGYSSRKYVFAMPITAASGSSGSRYLPITNMEGDCWEQINWLEVQNVSSSSITVTFSFRDDEGSFFESSDETLAAKAQVHYNASALLETRDLTRGSVKVTTDTSSSIITQSSVYYHDCSDNTLHTAYALPPVTPQELPIVGSFNRFLGANNELSLIGVTGSRKTVDLSLRTLTETEPFFEDSISLEFFSLLDFDLSNEDEFPTEANTLGTVELDSSTEESFVAYNVRVRMSGEDESTVDFALPTLFR